MTNPRTAATIKAIAAVGTAATLVFLLQSSWRNRKDGEKSSPSSGGGDAASSAANPSAPPLLQPAIEGHLTTVQTIVALHLVSLENPSSASEDEAAFAQFQERKSLADAADQQGNGAVHAAAFAGHLDVLRFLSEECGADLTTANGIGCTPLWLAAGYGHVDVLQYLVERTRMRLSAVFPDGEEAGKEFTRALSVSNGSGDSPLVAACHKGHGECARVLLRAAEGCSGGGGARDMLRATNKGGDTALHVAAGNVEGGVAAVKVLLEFIVDDVNEESSPETESVVDIRNSKLLTPLLIACERNSAPLVELLLSRSAEPLPDSNGLNPLAVAAFCGCDEAASALLGASSSSVNSSYASLLNEKCGEGRCTPLWLAARTGNAKMCEALLEAGADTELSNRDGLTPLGAAEKYKKEKAVVVLRKWGNARV